jgi:hypothetical protein
MPRVVNSGENVVAWCEQHGHDGASVHDVCATCSGRLEIDAHAFDGRLVPTRAGEPVGDAGWTGDVDHPPYAYSPAASAVCGTRLTSLDDRRSVDCCSTRTAAVHAHVPCIDVTRRRVQ